MDFNKTKQMVEGFFNGQYEVKKFLGEGSFAEVYLVNHVFLDDLRAMKIIKQPLKANSNNKAIFHEVSLATQLRHENIISIYDAGIISSFDNENKAYFVMEYVPGGDLEQYMNSFVNSNISMSIPRVLNLMKQILQGLNVLHSSNPVIVHRDLKLNNILLSYNSFGEIVIKISDFGFAKEITTDISDFEVAGTRPYMAPECFRKVSSTMTDIYAVGVIFYQLLTNSFPYGIEEFSLEEMLDAKPWKNALKPPSEYNDKISKELDEIVMKCLKINPEDRFHDASELLSSIEVIIDEFSPKTQGIPIIEKEFEDEFSDYIMNDSIKEAFRLAKCENGLNEAIEILEKEILSDYDIRECYGETLQIWKSENPDVKLISKAFTVNLRGKNYELSSNLLKEAIAYNPNVKCRYAHYIDLWEIFIKLAKSGNLIEAVISLENLMGSNNYVHEIYVNIISTLKTYSLEEIINESIRLANLNNLADAGNLMEFAVVADSRSKSKYAYVLSLWKQNMNSHFKIGNELKENTIDYAIDLGTVNSVISYYNNGDPIIIKNYKTGEDFTPSAVFIDEGNNVHVGDEARNAIISNANNAVSEFKNNMGFPIPYRFENSSQVLLPEELSSEVLKDLRVSVFEQYGVNVEDAVICCSANSNPMKTKAINDAAELAGFKSHNLILEPIAIALAYDLKASDEDKGIWMIYDLGGATFNVSIIKDNGEEIEKLATAGFENIGGDAFDWKIVEDIFAPQIIADLNLDDFAPNNSKYSEAFLKLKLAAEKIKKELSFSTKADISIDNLFDDYTFTCTLNREEFKEIISQSIKSTLDLCEHLLNENNFSSDDIDKIILAGGSCLSPQVRDLIKEEFDIPLEFSIDPLTVVAKGAAVYAGRLEKSSNKTAANEFSLMLNEEEDIISGKVFTLDDKFSFLGFSIEFIDDKTNESVRASINIDGEFKVTLNQSDYKINIYDGNDIVKLDNKSPNKLVSGKMHIPFFKNEFSLGLMDINPEMISKQYAEVVKQADYLREHDAFKEDDILVYLEKLFEIAQKDKRFVNQASIYLNYIDNASNEAIVEMEFTDLLENIENKIRFIKRNDLFEIDDLEDKLKVAIDKKDVTCLNDIHYKLIESYAVLNRDKVIKACFFNLIYEGIFTDYPEDLIEKAIGAINDNDYDLLFDIVNELYELDERN